MVNSIEKYLKSSGKSSYMFHWLNKNFIPLTRYSSSILSFNISCYVIVSTSNDVLPNTVISLISPYSLTNISKKGNNVSFIKPQVFMFAPVPSDNDIL